MNQKRLFNDGWQFAKSKLDVTEPAGLVFEECGWADMKPSVWQAIDELQRGMEDPVCAYIYDLAGIQEHVRQMLGSMPGNTQLFYEAA